MLNLPLDTGADRNNGEAGFEYTVDEPPAPCGGGSKHAGQQVIEEALASPASRGCGSKPRLGRWQKHGGGRLPLHAGADRNPRSLRRHNARAVSRFTRVRIETVRGRSRSGNRRMSPASRGCGSKPRSRAFPPPRAFVSRFTRVRIETTSCPRPSAPPAGLPLHAGADRNC